MFVFLLFYGKRKSWRRVVRNDSAHKTVHCGNRKCVVGLGDTYSKSRMVAKVCQESGSSLAGNG